MNGIERLDAVLEATREGRRLEPTELALLIDAALDGPAPQRELAVEALVGLVGNERYSRKPRLAIVEAARLLDGADPRLRRVGASLLQHDPPEPLRAKLIEHLSDEDEGVRAACARAVPNLRGASVAQVERLLGADSPEVRLRALNLRNCPDEAYRPSIRARLLDPVPSVRQAASLRLAEAGDGSPEVVAALAETAREAADTEPRSYALERLAAMAREPRALDALVGALLADPDESVRGEAAMLLRRSAATQERAARALVSALRCAPTDVALAAAVSLTQPGDAITQMAPELLSLFRDERLAEALRGQLGVALATAGRAEVLPDLMLILEAPDAQFREVAASRLTGLSTETQIIKLRAMQAIGALGRVASGTAAALLPFLEALPDMQEATAEALHPIGATGASVEAALASVSSRCDSRVRPAMLGALVATGAHLDVALVAILRALASSDHLYDEVRAHLCALKSETFVQRVQALSQSEDPETRGGAVEALLILGVPNRESLDRLVARLGGSGAQERMEAIAALRAFGTRAAPAAEGLQQLAVDVDPEVRAAVLAVSVPVGGAEPWVSGLLRAGLRDEGSRVREAACGALCDLTTIDSELLTLAEELQADPEARVRQAALRVPKAFESAGEASTSAPCDSGSQAAARASGRFSFRLCRALPDSSANFVLSSWSVFTLLSVLSRAAESHSRRELMEALGWRSGAGELLGALGDLAARLSSASPPDGFTLLGATGLWTQVGYPVHEQFLSDVRVAMGLLPASLDFAANPEAACDAINRWVGEKTKGRIGPLLASLAPQTRFALANAVYFKSRWARPFTDQTREMPFCSLDGTERLAPMMMKQGGFRYAACPDVGFEVIELPYQGEAASMLVVVPRSGFFGRVERLLDYDMLESALQTLEEPGYANLRMPKFALSYSLDLEEQVARLGAPSVLTAAADLTGITPLREPWAGKLLHQAMVVVDEKGTEAAAATVVCHIGGIPAEVVVDRPFLFFIRHNSTGVVLFNGRVVDPRATG